MFVLSTSRFSVLCTCSASHSVAVVKAVRLMAAQVEILRIDAANVHLRQLADTLPRAELVRCTPPSRLLLPDPLAVAAEVFVG